jgi:hypothetical protein
MRRYSSVSNPRYLFLYELPNWQQSFRLIGNGKLQQKLPLFSVCTVTLRDGNFIFNLSGKTNGKPVR